MKRKLRLLILSAVMATFAAPILAQTKECTDEFKSTAYQKWYDNRRDHQDVAYQTAKEYLATCPNETSPQAAAVKKFATAYESMMAASDSAKQFDAAFKSKNYAEQIRVGKLVLATNPDNPAVYIIMGVAGLSDPKLLTDSAPYAKKAIELIEAGGPFAPYDSKDKALAGLNYAIGKASLQNEPEAALPYLIKAARYETDLKKSPTTYLEIATAYEKGPRARLTADYEAKYKDKPETPESKLAVANIDQIIDRQIDAYARSAAFVTTPADKKAIMDDLTALYKYRNKDEKGLPELLTSVQSKPLPDVPTPITAPPTASPSPTP